MVKFIENPHVEKNPNENAPLVAMVYFKTDVGVSTTLNVDDGRKQRAVSYGPENSPELGLPATSGSFRQLYGQLQEEVSRNPRIVNKYGKSLDMSVGERKVSFLNKYFVYRKTHNVDAKSVSNSWLGQTMAEERLEHQETAAAIQTVESIVGQQKKANKTKRRLILKSS